MLLVGALGVAAYMLSNQRFYLPAWVPLMGTDFYEVKAELPTAQAVVPGQGQTVNVAGVKVGEVGEVNLVDGRAVVTMQIQDKYKPIYKDATILLRPEDRSEGHDPGARPRHAGRRASCRRAGASRSANTLPDVNAGRGALRAGRRHARLPADPAERRRDRVRDDRLGATRADAPRDLRETFKRFEPTARDAAQSPGARTSAGTTSAGHPHLPALSTALGSKDKQLAALVDSANANFQAFAQEESSLREALSCSRARSRRRPPRWTTSTRWPSELGPTLEGLRPFARELAPSLARQRPFLRDTTPIIRDQVRPFARDVQPTVRDLRAATSQARAGHAAA